MGLLGEWSRAAGQWDPVSTHYVLGADAECLKYYGSVTYRSWDEARQAPDFFIPNKGGDKRFHLGLLPVPFLGDLLNASIYVLMANPGVTPDDYREHEEPAFRRALLANLKQERLDGVLPFLYLDPQFHWHDGFEYWDKKLGKTIRELSRVRGITEPEARAVLCGKLAVIQMFPYHSANGPGYSKRLNSWPSVRLAGEFVRDTVVPRVRAGEAIVIAIRRYNEKNWGQYLPTDLSEEQGVMRSASAGAARSAALGPKSRWGRAILRHLGDAV